MRFYFYESITYVGMVISPVFFFNQGLLWSFLSLLCLHIHFFEMFEICDEQHGDVNWGCTECVHLFLSDGHFHGCYHSNP